jgi:hypothetical protein
MSRERASMESKKDLKVGARTNGHHELALVKKSTKDINNYDMVYLTR